MADIFEIFRSFGNKEIENITLKRVDVNSIDFENITRVQKLAYAGLLHDSFEVQTRTITFIATNWRKFSRKL